MSSTAEVDDVYEGQPVKKTTFEETPKMSTYLLAFIVSEFTYVEKTAGEVNVSVGRHTSAKQPKSFALPAEMFYENVVCVWGARVCSDPYLREEVCH